MVHNGIVAGEPMGAAGHPPSVGGLLTRAWRRRAARSRAGGHGPAAGPQSGLLIAVPEAEDLVGEWRRRLDPAARDGIPSHITLLFPFMAVTDVDGAVTDTLGRYFETVEPFDYQLHRVAWFGHEVIYVAPEPAERFRALTVALAAAWPAFRPYGGVHADIVPHLTVGDHARRRDMEAAADALAPRLPISARAHEVLLMGGAGPAGTWSTVHRFPLGGRRA